jgi:hypothetical protein
MKTLNLCQLKTNQLQKKKSPKLWAGVVVHAYNPSYSEGGR